MEPIIINLSFPLTYETSTCFRRPQWTKDQHAVGVSVEVRTIEIDDFVTIKVYGQATVKCACGNDIVLPVDTKIPVVFHCPACHNGKCED